MHARQMQGGPFRTFLSTKCPERFPPQQRAALIGAKIPRAFLSYIKLKRIGSELE